MLRKIQARVRMPTPATVIALLALFVALGGTGAQALRGQNRITSNDIAPRGVKSSDLARNSVRSGKVVDDSLDADDIDFATTRVFETFTLEPGSSQQVNPTCPSGVSTGSGWAVLDGNELDVVPIKQQPLPPDSEASNVEGWLIEVGNTGAAPAEPMTIGAWAVCIDD